MPVQYRDWISAEDLKREPDTLFVFGDNFLGRGYGGQARVMRGKPNAVGIPTKKAPGWKTQDFLAEADRYEWLRRARPQFDRLHAHLDKGGTVVIPRAGIGTGLAQLEERAPAIWVLLDYEMKRLAEHAVDAPV